MRLETLQVELRPRSPWEAVELGTALVRKNLSAIWRPWLLLVLPVFALINGAAWAIGNVWWAWLAMWWLKPVFDRIPLFVLSRAVFGATPTTRQTLAAQRHWGWRTMAQMLSWRRFGLSRALYLPIDLLEGADPKRLGARRRVLGNAVYGHAVQLTLVCLCFILALALSTLALVFLFVPNELLPESARAMWALVKDEPPPWALVAGNGVLWLATSVVEPFYIGAGFGLYLNRRTQIEAWDVEIAFRRMRTRLEAGAVTLLLACALGLPLTSRAQAPSSTAAPATEPPAATQAPAEAVEKEGEAEQDDEVEETALPSKLPEIFGDAYVDQKRFDRAVAKAYADPLLNPKRTDKVWQPRNRNEKPIPASPALAWLGGAIGFVGEYGLWLLLAALVVFLLSTAKRWWPWLRSAVATPTAEAAPIEVDTAQLPDILPDDIATAVRALWQGGQPRRALALLYRASVETMTERANVNLAPGATEAECLRASRRMPDSEDRSAFAHAVRVWQYAAYAQRFPADDEFESLLGDLARRFRWAA